MAFIDFRADYLRDIFFRLSFRDVIFDENLNNYIPNFEYNGQELIDHPFEAKITFHEVSTNYPSGNYIPFLTLKADEESNEVILNVNEVQQIRIVASAEWKKPGDQFLSVWSTSVYLDLMEQQDFRINLIMDQVSIGREPLMSYVSFSPSIDPKLVVDRKINLVLELIRTDVGAVYLPGTQRMHHRINLDEALVLELPRGQWYYTVRSVEV